MFFRPVQVLFHPWKTKVTLQDGQKKKTVRNTETENCCESESSAKMLMTTIVQQMQKSTSLWEAAQLLSTANWKYRLLRVNKTPSTHTHTICFKNKTVTGQEQEVSLQILCTSKYFNREKHSRGRKTSKKKKELSWHVEMWRCFLSCYWCLKCQSADNVNVQISE